MPRLNFMGDLIGDFKELFRLGVLAGDVLNFMGDPGGSWRVSSVTSMGTSGARPSWATSAAAGSGAGTGSGCIAATGSFRLAGAVFVAFDGPATAAIGTKKYNEYQQNK